MKRMFSLFFGLGAMLSIIPGYGATYEQIQNLTSTVQPDPVFSDDYGHFIHFEGDQLFIVATTANPGGVDVAGVVYVYEKLGDQYINTQVISTGGLSEHFGSATVKRFDDWLFISLIGTPAGPIPGDSLSLQDFKGSIQIYRFNHRTDQWEFSQAIDSSTPGLENLTPCDPRVLTPRPPVANTVDQGAAFGLYFDFNKDQNILLVGAPQQNTNNNINAGAVYSFKYNEKNCKSGEQPSGWVLQQTILNPDGVSANDTFGGNVQVNDDIALISNSAIFTDVHVQGLNTFVYVYQYVNSNWQFIQKLNGDQTNTTPLFAPALGGNILMGDNFGASMAFDGKWAIIGAPFENLGSQTIKGAAYLFKFDDEKNRFKFAQKIVSDDPGAVMTGVSVSVNNNIALVGDPTHVGPNNTTAQGALLAYYYDRPSKTWIKEANLFDSMGFAYQLFGNGVASKGKIIAGGTGTAVTTLFLQFFIYPPLLTNPVPLLPNNAVIFQRNP